MFPLMFLLTMGIVPSSPPSKWEKIVLYTILGLAVSLLIGVVGFMAYAIVVGVN